MCYRVGPTRTRLHPQSIPETRSLGLTSNEIPMGPVFVGRSSVPIFSFLVLVLQKYPI